MSAKTQVFVTGATGYLGGSVLDRLLKHRTFATSEFTVLVRKQEKATVLQSLGIKTVLGSYDDVAVLEKQASQSDVVFAIVDSDNAPASEAILRGLRKRFEATGKPSTLIHTTGSAIVMDSAQGEATSEAIWDDADIARINTIQDTKLHRNVDVPILAADKEGYVNAYLLSPPTIFGMPSGKLMDLGIQNTRSIQIPMAVACSVGRKSAGHVGQGDNLWPATHVNDTADMFIVLYDAILNGKAGHGSEGTYFGENGHYTSKQVADKIAEALHELGVTPTMVPPSPFTPEDFKKFPYLGLLGTNCKIKASRIRALGWQPKYTTEDLLNSIKGDVQAQLNVKA